MIATTPRRATQQLAFACTLIAMLALSGCSQETQAEPEEKSGPPPAFATNVVGFKSESQDLTDSISIVGSLESNESIEIRSEINGTIEKINFTEGGQVKANTVLFEFEQTKLSATLNQARANLQLAETTAKRYENLVKSKAVSRQEYDEVMASLKTNQATVELAREELNDATIVAPFGGIMGERSVSEGQYVTQGTVLGFLFNKDPIKAVFAVPERYLSRISNKQRVKVKVSAYKEEIFEGEVYFIDPKIDATTRTAMIKAKIPNPDQKLSEGMFASVDLTLDIIQNAVVIPETALIVKADTISVYVVKSDDTVELRSITAGRRVNGMVEVTAGLEANETVVLEGYQKIGPGSKVKVRFEDPTEKKFYDII